MRLPFPAQYIGYLLSAKNPSSPRFKPWVNGVADKQNFKDSFQKIEELKKEILTHKKSISVNDKGAGSAKNNRESRSIRSIAVNTGLPAKYGKLLFRLVEHFKAANILELGTGLGISTLYLSMPGNARQVTTLEGSPNIALQARLNFQKAKLQNITLIEGDFADTLPSALKKLESPDLIFIDGDHRKEKLLRYFNECLPFLKNNSIMVLDDIRWSAGMYEAWQELTGHPQVTLSIDLFRMGVLFFRKELKKETVQLFY